MKKKIYLLGVWLFFAIAYSYGQGPVIENGVLKSWPDAKGEITIPDEVLEIDSGVFYNNRKVTALHLNKVQIAGKNCCRNMSGVLNFTAPQLKIAKDSAFLALGSFRTNGRELILPEATELHTASMQLNTRYSRIILPKIKVLKSKSLAINTIKLIDMSLSDLLTEVEENAFPIPTMGGKIYIVVADSTALQLLPQDIGNNEKIITSVANFSNQQPQITIHARGDVGERPISTRFTSNELHEILGVDMGDGLIRAIPMDAEAWGGGTQSSEWSQSYKYPIDNPTLKLYGEVSSLKAIRPFAVNMSNATYLEKLMIESVTSEAVLVFGNQNAKLRNLELSYAKVTDLDLSMLSLTHFRGNSSKQLANLKLCNTLQEITIQNCTSLTGTLDVSAMSALTKLSIYGAQYSDVIFSPSLEELNCAKNLITGTLNVSALTKLKKLDCSHNQLTGIVLNPQLEDLNCSGNQLTSISVKNLADLKAAYINKNRVKSSQLNQLYAELPDRKNASINGKLYVVNKIADQTDDNELNISDVSVAFSKNWKLYDIEGKELTGMILKNDTLVSWNDASGDIVIPENVKVIADNCFRDNPNITSITGNGVEYIGDHCGTSCSKLTRVSFPKLKATKLWPVINAHDDRVRSTQIFVNCPNLAPIIAGNTLFADHNASGDITLPDSITTIYHSAFYGATGLTGLTANGVTEIKSCAFGENYADFNCTELANCTLPNLRKTDPALFRHSEKLQSVVNSYGIFLWRGGGSVSIPEGIEVIGCDAFYENTLITSVTFPSSLKEIRQGAFQKATALSGTLTFPTSLSGIAKAAFSETAISGHLFIPPSVTVLSTSAFNRCTQLTSINVQATVSTLASGAFSYCNNVTEVELGKSITGLAKQSFVQCSKLSKLTMHSPVRMAFGSEQSSNYGFCLYGTNVNEMWVPSALIPSYSEIVHQNQYGGMSGWSSGWLIALKAIPNTTGNFPVTWENPANGTIEVSVNGNLLTSGSSVAAGTVIDIIVKTPTGIYNVDEINISGAMFNEVRSMPLIVSGNTHITATLSELPELANMEPLITMTTNVEVGELLKMNCIRDIDGYQSSSYYSGGTNYLGYIPISYPIIIDWGNGAFVKYRSNRALYTFINERIQGKDIKIYCDDSSKLKVLECSHMQLTQLDVTKAIALERLYCGATTAYGSVAKPNTLTELDLTQNVSLKILNCSSNQLTSLDLTQNIDLDDLDVSKNLELHSVDLSKNTKLKSLSFNYINSGTMPDLSHNTELEAVGCIANKIDTINLKHLTKLRSLDCSNNPVSSWQLPNSLNYIRFNNSLYQPCEWNELYKALPSRTETTKGELIAVNRYTGGSQTSLPILQTTNTQLASDKNWAVKENVTAHSGIEQDIIGDNTGCLSGYTVTFSATHGSVTAIVDGVQITSGATVGYNKEVVFVLSADEHYALSRLKVNGNYVSWSTPPANYVTKVKSNITLEAVYSPKHYLLTYIQPVNGTLSITNNGVDVASNSFLPYNTQIVANAVPNAGYELDKLTVSGTDYTTSPQNIVINKHKVISATFKPKAYTVTYSQPTNGTLSVTYNGTPVASGSSVPHGVTLVIAGAANSGYELTKLTINGTDYTTSPQHVTVSENISASATFSPKIYTVTYSQPVNGTISVTNNGTSIANGGSVAYGSALVVSATPNDGYELDKLTINGTDYTTSPQNVTVSGNVTVSATFILKTYAITYSQPANGTLSVTHNGTPVASGSSVPHGATVAIAATPNDGYELDKLTINGTDYTTSPQNIIVNENVKISAMYKLKTGIDNISTMDISIYPNPFRNSLRIKTDEQIQSIIVYDYIGRLLYKIPGNQRTINTGSWSNGTYIIRLVCNKGTKEIQVIKK